MFLLAITTFLQGYKLRCRRGEANFSPSKDCTATLPMSIVTIEDTDITASRHQSTQGDNIILCKYINAWDLYKLT